MGATQKSKWTQWTKLMNGRNELIGFYRTNGKKVQVRAMHDNIRGEATCNKTDVFNLYIGINVAYLRMKKKIVDKVRFDCQQVLEGCDKEEREIQHKIKNLINSVSVKAVDNTENEKDNTAENADK